MTSRAQLLFFALVVPVYFFAFPYNYGLNNPNENARLYTTLALVEHHTFRLDDEVARFGPINDAAIIGGHRYAAKAPAVSLLGVPIYFVVWKLAPHWVRFDDNQAWLTLVTVILRVVVVQLPCFLFLLWFHRWLRRRAVDPVLALVATAALGLGSNYLAYAQMFCSHSLAAIVAFVAFTLILDDERPLAAGLLAGAVTLFDYQGAVVSLLLGLLALATYRQRRARLMFCAAAVMPIALLMAFQHFAFGSVWRAPFHDLEDENLRAHHTRGLFGFGWPRATAFGSLCLDRTVGLFGTSPFAWLALVGVALGWRDRAVRWAAAFVLVLLVAVAGITNWRGGWSVGPRYLVTVMPFVVFTAAAGLQRLVARGDVWRAVARGAAGGLLVASVATVGVLSILFNTLPRDIESPLRQVVIPFLRAGFVPHHAGELVGWSGPAFFYVLVAALLAAGLVAALAAPRDALVRWPVALVCLTLALLPSLAMRPAECPAGVRRLTEIWEPAGRDRIGTLRAAAHLDPCRWRDVAPLERALCWQGADDDERQAPSHGCR